MPTTPIRTHCNQYDWNSTNLLLWGNCDCSGLVNSFSILKFTHLHPREKKNRTITIWYRTLTFKMLRVRCSVSSIIFFLFFHKKKQEFRPKEYFGCENVCRFSDRRVNFRDIDARICRVSFRGHHVRESLLSFNWALGFQFNILNIVNWRWKTIEVK